MYRNLFALLVMIVVCCLHSGVSQSSPSGNSPVPTDQVLNTQPTAALVAGGDPIPPDPVLDAQLTAALQAAGMTGTIETQFTDPNGIFLKRGVNSGMADLGRNLFFDKILGLNNDNACAGCHSPLTGMGDTQPIAIGVDNNNLVGPARKGPRNMRRAPLVLNVPLYPNMMWNSRFVAQSGNPFVPGTSAQGFQFPAASFSPSAVQTPPTTPTIIGAEGQGFGAGNGIPQSTSAAYSILFGSPSITGNTSSLNIPNLATAQVFMPTVQFNEMAGFNVPGTLVGGPLGSPYSKADVSAQAVTGTGPFDQTSAHNVIRNTIVARLNDSHNYRKLFSKQFPAVSEASGGITYTMVATAIAEFEFSLVRANAPIDQYARAVLGFPNGDKNAMTSSQKYGALLFFTATSSGGAGCIACHKVSGTNNEMFSDFGFHVSGVPQIMPTGIYNTRLDNDTNSGDKGAAYDQDFAWFDFTTRLADKYKFRTAPLRNVGALSPFFFHDGAFNRLEDAIYFHLDANTNARTYSPKGRLPHGLHKLGPIEPILQLMNNQPGDPGVNIFNSVSTPLPNGLNETVFSSTPYKVGDILTVVGGTGTAATLKVTSISANGTVTAASVNTPGSYSVFPTNPVATTAQSPSTGAGATFNLTGTTTVTGVTFVPANPLATRVSLTQTQFSCLVDFVRYGLLDPRAAPDQLSLLIPPTLPSGMTPLVFE